MLRSLTSRSIQASRPLRASSLLFPAQRAVAQSLRTVATNRITPDEEQSILVEQRKNRPMSPHLEIYQPQLTWYLSGAHRITGVALAFALYGGAVAYAVGPLVGLPFTFSGVAAAWGAAPAILKFTTKALIALPFTFHSFNGIRHLIWDSGRELTLKGVYRTGYTVLGLTAITTVLLALW